LRVAALADIHGNLPALEAVLRELQDEEPDLIVFCGDVASGPMPSVTIDVLRASSAFPRRPMSWATWGNSNRSDHGGGKSEGGVRAQSLWLPRTDCCLVAERGANGDHRLAAGSWRCARCLA